jgi:hypothetical protein
MTSSVNEAPVCFSASQARSDQVEYVFVPRYSTSGSMTPPVGSPSDDERAGF